MKFGKINHYCPVCGEHLYDEKITSTAKAMICSIACLEKFELQYARCILGKDEEEIGAAK